MAGLSQLRCSSLHSQSEFHYSTNHHRAFPIESAVIHKFSSNSSFSCLKSSTYPLHPFLLPRLQAPSATGGDGSGNGGDGGWGGGDGDGEAKRDDPGSDGGFGPIGAFLSGWRSRVAADPQFPFKVLMEELVGVTACVIGDMASRPNFGLDELDLVFSTLVVGCILNFTLMYLLAPTSTSSSQLLPSIFAGCPPSHMFEPGQYGLLSRFGTFVYKGTIFAAVGFGAGLVGTAISNGLIKMKKKMDPNFEAPSKAPPTILNALTWAIHMAVSCNFRYQTVNGIEYVLAKGLPPLVFKSSVVGLRCLNNVLGGMSFVILARLTGSQAAAEAPASPPPPPFTEDADTAAAGRDNLLVTKEEECLSNKDSATQ